MCVSPFQKRHKQRKAHDDHNVTSDTAIAVGTSFICLCRTDKSVLSIFFFSSSFGSRNAAGCRTRQAWICTCDYFRLSCLPCPQIVLPCFCQTGHGRQDRLNTCAVGRKLATASHARMTMTVAGLLSRRQESGAFPLSVAPPIELPRGALRHPLYIPFSFPPLQQVCRYSHAAIPDGISGHFRCRGKGKDGIRFSKFFSHNLHTSQAQVVFCRKNLQNLLPNLCMAPETKTTDARSEDVTRKHRTYGEAKRKRSRPDLPIRARQVTTT